MLYSAAGTLVPISPEDYKAAHTAGKQAGNKSMTADKRKGWNKKDFRTAADAMDQFIFSLANKESS